jgi:hypothetical protein
MSFASGWRRASSCLSLFGNEKSDFLSAERCTVTDFRHTIARVPDSVLKDSRPGGRPKTTKSPQAAAGFLCPRQGTPGVEKHEADSVSAKVSLADCADIAVLLCLVAALVLRKLKLRPVKFSLLTAISLREVGSEGFDNNKSTCPSQYNSGEHCQKSEGTER